MVTDIKKIGPLRIFLPEMNIYERYSNKTKFMTYLYIIYKYMTTWEKVSSIIIKKNKSGFMYNKKYLKSEKRFNTKENFQCFYIPITLFDSVYIKDGNYYPKVFLEKFIHSFLLQKHNKFWFMGLWKLLLKYNNFSKLGTRKFRFLKCDF